MDTKPSDREIASGCIGEKLQPELEGNPGSEAEGSGSTGL